MSKWGKAPWPGQVRGQRYQRKLFGASEGTVSPQGFLKPFPQVFPAFCPVFPGLFQPFLPHFPQVMPTTPWWTPPPSTSCPSACWIVGRCPWTSPRPEDWYGGWKKSCSTLDGLKPIDTGINHINWCRISSIHSMFSGYMEFFGYV